MRLDPIFADTPCESKPFVVRIAANVRGGRISTKPFDLTAALSGAPFIHRCDVNRPDASARISSAIVRIDHPEHPAYLVYCGEWLVYDWSNGEIGDMAHELLLVDCQQVEAAKEAVNG